MSATPEIRRVAVTTPLVPEPAPLGLDERNPMVTFEFAKYANLHSNEYIRLADSKAAILITLLSANLLVLVQRTGEYISARHSTWHIVLVLVACLYATISLGVAINVIRPRLVTNRQPGHFFWEDVAHQDKAAYAASFEELTPRAMFRELGDHNHNLSRTAVRKYRWLRIGFFMAMVSVAFSAGVILLTSG
jgi:hypothetical protein